MPTRPEQALERSYCSLPAPCVHPPRARLVVRVGVTGHRPKGLASADLEVLNQRIDSILACVQNAARSVAAKGLYNSQPPCFRVISSLAEGADRIVVQRGLQMGYELQSPLPYFREEYENDFPTAGAKREFRELLQQSSSVFEINGSREHGPYSYLAVGRIVIHHCDCLIAIWDGKPAAGPGGTAEVVEEAGKLNLPVILIGSHSPHKITYKQNEEPLQELSKDIEQLLLPRNSVGEDDSSQGSVPPGAKKDLRESYFNENRPSWSVPIYKVFERFVSQGSIRIKLRPGKGEPLNNPDVYAHFDWATTMSVYYAELCRSVSLLTQLLAALAVLSAVLPLFPPFKQIENRFVLAELVFISIIVVIVSLGSHYRWHERWLAYRILAERLRVLDYLAALSCTLPVFRPPAHLDRSDSNLSWVNWHFCSIVREIGLKPAKVSAEYLGKARLELRSVLVSQRDFHAATARRCHNLHHRLHVAGQFLFYFTLLACLLHLLVGHWNVGLGAHFDDISSWLIILAAALPATGAALAGILGHAEAERVGGQSHAMSLGLNEIVNKLDKESAPGTLEELSKIAEEAAHAMTDEVQDWHVLFKGRPIELPS
jgi:hypothetical protein